MESKTRFSVLLTLISLFLFSIGVGVSAGELDTSQQAANFDIDCRNMLLGEKRDKIVSSGPLFDRVQKVKAELKCDKTVYLVQNEAFNAQASSTEIFLFTGLVEKTDDAQLALVLAHEWVHIAHFDFCQFANKMNRARKKLKSAAGMLSGSFKESAKFVEGLGMYIPGVVTLIYSKDTEYQADATACIILKASGVDVAKAVALFDLMKEQTGQLKGLWLWLSTHPAPDQRKTRIVENVAKKSDKEIKRELLQTYASNTEEVDPSPYEAMCQSQNFTGYAYRALDEKKLSWVLCKGSGELKRTEDVIYLPKDVTGIVFLLLNPNPKKVLDGMLTIYPDDDSLVLMSILGERKFNLVSNMALSAPTNAVVGEGTVNLSVAYGNKLENYLIKFVRE